MPREAYLTVENAGSERVSDALPPIRGNNLISQQNVRVQDRRIVNLGRHHDRNSSGLKGHSRHIGRHITLAHDRSSRDWASIDILTC
jgi:hypothetical protein